MDPRARLPNRAGRPTIGDMPCFRARRLHAGAELAVDRVECDGHDAPRPSEESFAGGRLIVVLRGGFVLRHRRGRDVVDVARAVLTRGGRPFVMRHPRAGGDACLSLRGPLVEALLDDYEVADAEARPISADQFLQARRLADGASDGWAALLEALAARPGERATAASAMDRQIAAAIDFVIGERFDGPLPLGELARAAGVSVFHACRAFRRATGTTIHAHLRERRLRHALGAVLDGQSSLATVAHACGFASHAHLTDSFRSRFAVPPSRLRRG